MESGKPVMLLLEGQDVVRPPYGIAGKGWWIKRKSFVNRSDMGLCPDTKVCRLPPGDSLQETYRTSIMEERK